MVNHKFSVIGISETWLQDLAHTVDINEYNFVDIDLYLSLYLEYKLRNDLTFPQQSCVESLFIEIITNSKGKNIFLLALFTGRQTKMFMIS